MSRNPCWINPQTFERYMLDWHFQGLKFKCYLTISYSNVINKSSRFLRLHEDLFTHFLQSTGGGVWGHFFNNQQNSFINPLSAYPHGRWPLAANLRLPKNLFSCKTLICRPIVRTPIPVLILPDPLSVKKYKSENCRRCCKRVVSTNCQINKSEHMIIHNIVRRAGAQLMRPDIVCDERWEWFLRAALERHMHVRFDFSWHGLFRGKGSWAFRCLTLCLKVLTVDYWGKCWKRFSHCA